MNNPVQPISNALQDLAGITNGIAGFLTPEAPSFWAQLRPASWRGVPFAVLEGQAQFGRRVQVHEYPFRDTVWVEDFGRQGREFQVTGFIVGDDVIAQRDRLLEAIEARSSVTGDKLIHPTFGERSVVLTEFQCRERTEHGRVFELQFTFIEQGQRQFPGDGGTTSTAAQAAAAAADESSLKAFVRRVAEPLRDGATVVNRLVQEAARWGRVADRAVRDATSLVHMVAALPGAIGRLVDASTSIKVSSTTTLRDLAGRAAAGRQAVVSAVAGLNAGAASIDAGAPEVFGTHAAEVVAAVLAAASRPADAVRALQSLAGFQPQIVADPSQVGLSAAVVQRAAGDLFRRAAVAGLVRAAADYRLDSSAAAVALRDSVVEAVEAEIWLAGDQGEDEAFVALRALRAAAVADLNARGARLPELITVATPAPVPALVLAQRLYRDARRCDELVARAQPVHPAFMPTVFEALSE